MRSIAPDQTHDTLQRLGSSPKRMLTTMNIVNPSAIEATPLQRSARDDDAPPASPAVHAAIRIMSHLRECGRAVGVSEIARATGLHKSTVHGIVRTLAAAEYLVEIEATKQYRLGPALVALGDAVRDPRAAVAIARPFLEEAARELRLACFIAAPCAGGEFVIVDRAQRTENLRVTAAVGERFPIAAGAVGKAFLAWRRTQDVHQLIERCGLPDRNANAIRHPRAYLKELARVRKLGYAESLGEYQGDTHALAAPVFDARGDVSLVLLVVGFPRDLPSSLMKHHGAWLRALSDRITRSARGVVPAAADFLETVR